MIIQILSDSAIMLPSMYSHAIYGLCLIHIESEFTLTSRSVDNSLIIMKIVLLHQLIMWRFSIVLIGCDRYRHIKKSSIGSGGNYYLIQYPSNHNESSINTGRKYLANREVFARWNIVMIRAARCYFEDLLLWKEIPNFTQFTQHGCLWGNLYVYAKYVGQE